MCRTPIVDAVNTGKKGMPVLGKIGIIAGAMALAGGIIFAIFKFKKLIDEVETTPSD